jgi:hypothetical protein
MEEVKKGRFSASVLTFAVRHELRDGNIEDHPDQGVAILVTADVAGKETSVAADLDVEKIVLEPTPNLGATD